MNRIKSNLPNFLTLLNLFSGILALFFVFQNNWENVFLWVLVGIIFDFFDGMIARWLKVSGEMGLQLDSLADMVTSGLVPSITLFFLIQNSFNTDVFHPFIWDVKHLLPFIALLVAAASAWRLAKFNIDERQTSSFIGLPTPGNALMILSIPWILEQKNPFFSEIFQNPWFLSFLAIFSSFLLNMNVPLFSFKFKNFNWKNNREKYILIFISIFLLILYGPAALFWIVLFYIFLSILSNQLKSEVTH